MQSCWWSLLCQTTDELPASDGDHSDAASADTDEDGEVCSTDDDDEDTDAGGDDDEFVDAGAGDEVEDRAPWVRERRHSGDGEVRRHARKHFTALFRDYPGEPVPEEVFFWTLWCKGR